MLKNNSPQDTSQDDDPQDGLSGPNADAIRDARRRVDAREKAAREERERLNQQRQREAWWQGGGLDMTGGGFLGDLLGLRFAGFALTLAGFFLLSTLMLIVESLRTPFYWMVHVLDIVTGGHILPSAPWVLWTMWGGVFGAALGYWLIAPLYGNRENRSLVLWLPLLLMSVTGIMLWAFL